MIQGRGRSLGQEADALPVSQLRLEHLKTNRVTVDPFSRSYSWRVPASARTGKAGVSVIKAIFDVLVQIVTTIFPWFIVVAGLVLLFRWAGIM